MTDKKRCPYCKRIIEDDPEETTQELIDRGEILSWKTGNYWTVCGKIEIDPDPDRAKAFWNPDKQKEE